MKLSNYKEVEKLLDIRQTCLANLETIPLMRADALNLDSGGIAGYFEQGYSAHFSWHRDGSGTSLDMAGAYVGVQCLAAIEEVLENQLKKVDTRLNELGVVIDE